MMDWTGKRVIVIGVARQGIALARYLASRGARVVVNDLILILVYSLAGSFEPSTG